MKKIKNKKRLMKIKGKLKIFSYLKIHLIFYFIIHTFV